MKNIFRYDYNNKLFFINLLLSTIFFSLSIVFYKTTLAFILTLIMSILAFFNSFFIRLHGINLNNKNEIIIIDELLVRKLAIKDIKYVALKQVSKKTKNNIYGFFHEFFYPHTYMSHCNYVYNQGKVYNICFYMNDGTIIESYFGWLYREKEAKVKKVEAKLLCFIKNVNILCSENRKKIKELENINNK